MHIFYDWTFILLVPGIILGLYANGSRPEGIRGVFSHPTRFADLFG
jgi:hypothetical protein